MSSYRPRYTGLHYDDIPPPPPPADLPPLPRGPPPPAYNGGDSWHSHSRQGFDFGNIESAPRYPPQVDSYRPPRRQRSPRRNRARPQYSDNRNLNRPGGRHNSQFGRGPRLASNRPLLHHQHQDDNSELEMLGVTGGAAKYLDDEEVSDSEEQEMELSDSDREEGEVAAASFDGVADSNTLEPPSKRRDIGGKYGDADDRPKWSNPDPYFALPPTDDTLANRKDPVETIRKYRKPKDDQTVETNQVTANDDFISFAMDGDGEAETDSSQADDDLILATAPSAPRQMKPQRNDIEHSRSLESRKTTTEDWGRAYYDLTDGTSRRKRGHGDMDHNESHQILNRDLLRADVGLRDEWRPKPNTDLVPWLRHSAHITSSAGFRLHKEICDFYDFVRPQGFEGVIRQELLDRLEAMIHQRFADCSVHCFGSFAAGLYLPTADMDVVVISNEYAKYGERALCRSHNQLYKFADHVIKSGLAKPGSVNVIAQAKVPLIKFVDSITSIRVDLCFENDSGVRGLAIFDQWKDQYPAMPVLVSVIKQFLMMRGLNEVVDGGIGGYSVICLVTSLLQNMSLVKAGKMTAEEHLGEMLIEFLDLYGNRFDISRVGIVMEPPRYFDKVTYPSSSKASWSLIEQQHSFNRPRFQHPTNKPSRPDRLTIMDPNNPDRDIAGGSHKVLAIFAQFAEAQRRIMAAMKSTNRPSLLDWMLGGSYRELIDQRARLRSLYNVRYTDQREQPKSLNKTAPLNSMTKEEVGQRSRATELKNKFPEVASSIPDLLEREAFKGLSKRLASKRSTRDGEGPTENSNQKVLAKSLKQEFPDAKIPEAIDKRTFDSLREMLSMARIQAQEKQNQVTKEQIGRTRADQLKRDFPDAAAKIPSILDRDAFVKLARELENAGIKRNKRGQASLPARPPLPESSRFAAINAPNSSEPQLPQKPAPTLETVSPATGIASGMSSADAIPID
ncbi:uncharacterized protein KY384_005421 [Bacidia gigantensis]|uniref:uncharacterized protein n=1 Tax=Bacidia gigantensis TaxID=2732470 RepID=UPI001D0557CA|nr:uncharacterized protein KY384_005421 [Bacidia gigantensis]KAG8529940.1 hypothetical protein KY384_005421 [Bacidia gigantensis]